MEDGMAKILFIVGSHRQNSFNKQLANEIIAMIGVRAECSIENKLIRIQFKISRIE